MHHLLHRQSSWSLRPSRACNGSRVSATAIHGTCVDKTISPVRMHREVVNGCQLGWGLGGGETGGRSRAGAQAAMSLTAAAVAGGVADACDPAHRRIASRWWATCCASQTVKAEYNTPLTARCPCRRVNHAAAL